MKNHVKTFGGFDCPCNFFGKAENAHGHNFHCTPYLPMGNSVFSINFRGQKGYGNYHGKI